MRAFVEKEIMPYTYQWDEAKAVPLELFEKCAQSGWLAAVVGAPWQSQYPFTRFSSLSQSLLPLYIFSFSLTSAKCYKEI